MKAKCKKCGDTVEVTRPREFKSCKCGAIALDYGDGYYFRVGGNLEDFDGEIEDVPKINDDLVYRPNIHKVKSRQTGKQVAIADDPAERAMDIIGEENIGGESKPTKKFDELHKYLSKAVKVKKSFWNVNVDLCEDGTLWIDDAETDEQLAEFKVVEGK